MKRTSIANYSICRGDVVVHSLTMRVNDVIQPRFDRLTSLQTEVAQSQTFLVRSFNRISSGLEFIHSSLAKLDQPVSFGGDHFMQQTNVSGRFVRLNNIDSGISRPFNSLGLDFMSPASGAPLRCGKPYCYYYYLYLLVLLLLLLLLILFSPLRLKNFDF